MKKIYGLCLLGSLLAIVSGVANALPFSLNFPTPQSITGGPTGSGPLGVGGGGAHYVAGDEIEQLFPDTGLSSVSSARWQFSIDDLTEAGTFNSFSLMINGNIVGSFSFIGEELSKSHIHDFDLATSFAPISGDDYLLQIASRSTVPFGAGSWNWLPGGTVAFNDPAVIPEPGTLVLLSAGLVALRIGRKKHREK